MPKVSTYPKCFDPYLHYAISTDFETFEFFREKKKRLFLLAEFNKAGDEKKFAREMNKAGFSVVIGPADDDIRYITLHTNKDAVVEAVSGSLAFGLWEKYVSRVELSLPLKPLSAALMRRRLVNRWLKGQESPGSVLIGVLDDGCPFAAAHFLRFPAGVASTRVRGIWDQNQGKPRIKVDDLNGKPCFFGQTPFDFNYGLEFFRDSEAPVPAPLRRQMGLDEWIQLHSTPTGSIDEDGCYADADFKSLARRGAHGAHVMDVFAGRVPTSSRIGPSPPGDRRDPPNWQAGTDPASAADVVFVQFPDDCIRDATGVWLKAYVLDGIRYILSFADPTKIDNVVINLSYGPTTGPHDGTAELEAAMTALTAEFNGTTRKPKLEIVLAAGNAYLSEGHIVFCRNTTTQPDYVEWTWRIPPDNTALCFAEIWMKENEANGVTVTLRSPGGASCSSTTGPAAPPYGDPLPPYTGAYAPLVWGTNTVWLLAVEPTIAASGLVPEHGGWTIEVEGIGVNAEVHAYVARSDPNMGVRTGARRSYFVDPEWEQTRSAEAACAYIDGEFDKRGSLIHRFGTLNGIATDDVSSVHVAGGYILANGRKSPYSSAGPARGGSRLGPDYALPCDESYALQGIRAGGNRSGSVFRLIGTSAAAPQLARWICNPPLPVPTDIPTTPSEVAKRGKGNLRPP
jgi:hypothetical protein